MSAPTEIVTPDTPDMIATALRRVRQEIAQQTASSGRDPAAAHLIAVSKFQPVERIREALAAGQRRFGENRVQEAKAKWPELRAELSDIELHLIGPLQTNKVRDAVALFDVIQTLDREKLALALAEECRAQNRRPALLIQVNTGNEPQKAGIDPLALPDFLQFCRQDCQLQIDGLMCIPPAEEEPALHFALLSDLARRQGLSTLSMGMSADYGTAIRFGATMVRLGTAIFGDRPPTAAAGPVESLAEAESST